MVMVGREADWNDIGSGAKVCAHVRTSGARSTVHAPPAAKMNGSWRTVDAIWRSIESGRNRANPPGSGLQPTNRPRTFGSELFLGGAPFQRLNLCDRFDASMCHCASEPARFGSGLAHAACRQAEACRRAIEASSRPKAGPHYRRMADEQPRRRLHRTSAGLRKRAVQALAISRSARHIRPEEQLEECP
jgi:hypothetical protein